MTPIEIIKMFVVNPSKYLGFLLFISLNIAFYGISQESEGFASEVKDIQIKYDTILDASRDNVVFTGSSSIRLWESLEEYFPDQQIVNSGFGGSQTSDLLTYIDMLVLRYKPTKVFIYEGDNDLMAKKKPKLIIEQTQQVIEKIRAIGTAQSIVLISAKPSIQRWHLRGRYKRLNRKFEKLSRKDPLLEFVDVWSPMLNGKKLRVDLFIEDGLHMNEKGYAIWFEALKNYVN